MYKFRVKYVKGKVNCAADTLSYYLTIAIAPKESEEAEDTAKCAAMVNTVMVALYDYVVDLW